MQVLRLPDEFTEGKPVMWIVWQGFEIVAVEDTEEKAQLRARAVVGKRPVKIQQTLKDNN